MSTRGSRSILARIGGRLWRLVAGNHRLLPGHVADPMWHLERARHRIRGGEMIVRFDNLDADIALDARSDLAMRALGEGTYEPELLAALPQLVGSGDAINVGANVGVVAIVMRRAMASGTTLACVEPIEDCVGRLQRNLEGAGAANNVVISRAFATDKQVDSHAMWTVSGRPEYSSGGRLVHPSVATADHVTTTVPALRLDDLAAAEGLKPTAIVMDCEGGEFNALRGAAGLIASCQPVVVMEFDPPLLRANGGDAAAFLRFFGNLGYRCLALADPPADVHEAFSGTVVAVPATRVEWAGRVIATAACRKESQRS